MGNLVVDLRAQGLEPRGLPPLERAVNVTQTLSSKATAGGTAWSFALALRGTEPAATPHLLGCVGDDLLGRAVIAAMEDAALPTSGIETTDAAPTGAVVIAYALNGARLMFSPAERADRMLSVGFTTTFLEETSVRIQPALLWISGYCIAGEASPRHAAAAAGASWARESGVPIVVDLVPHAFAAAVGDIDTVEARLGGPIDGVVAEYGTAREILGEPVAADLISGMTRAARALAKDDRAVIIQHQTGSDRYSQVLTHAGTVAVDHVAIPPTDRTGLGDVMAVAALHRLGWLTAS